MDQLNKKTILISSFILTISCFIISSNAGHQNIFTSFGESLSHQYRPQNVINSLITPIIPRSECFTSADNRSGLCMSRKTCISTGGIPAGTCGVIGSCCIYQGSCRAVINSNETYFVSPSYPNSQPERMDPPICIFTLMRDHVLPIKWPVCQIRIDFDEFNLAPPFNGSCGGATDAFVISGATSFNASGLPDSGLCGDMSGQHMFINVDPDQPKNPLLFVVNAANDRIFSRKWSIRIRQIQCKSPQKAPAGCLQYHTATAGVIESFNFRGLNRNQNVNPLLATGSSGNQPLYDLAGNNPFISNQNGMGSINSFPGINNPILQQQQPGFNQFLNYPNPKYVNGLNYGICIAQHPDTCGIRWEVRSNVA